MEVTKVVGLHYSHSGMPGLEGWQRISMRVLAAIGFYIASIIVLVACGSMAQQSGLGVLSALPLACAAFMLVTRFSGFSLSGWFSSTAFFAAMQLLSFFVMLHVGLMVVPAMRWDCGTLIHAASSIVLEGSLGDNPLYFVRYPHNRFWLECLVVLFKVAHRIRPAGTFTYLVKTAVLFGVTIVQLTIIVVRLVATRLLGREKASLIWLFCLAYLPLYCYAPILYNDTPSMFVCALIIYCYVCIQSSQSQSRASRLRKAVLLILLGALCGIAHRLRVIVLIVPLAMLVASLFLTHDRRIVLKSSFVVVVAFAISSAAGSVFASQHFPTDEFRIEDYEVPLTHYVSMSFGDGRYNADDVKEMYALNTVEERKARGAERLLERIRERGIRKTIEFALVTKQAILWGDSFLQSDYYINDQPSHPDSLAVRLLAKDGSLHDYVLPISWALHLLMVFGIGFSFLRQDRVDSHRLWTQLSVLGVFAFFSLWECSPRYLTCFLPAIALCSSYGWSTLCNVICPVWDDLGKAIKGVD